MREKVGILVLAAVFFGMGTSYSSDLLTSAPEIESFGHRAATVLREIIKYGNKDGGIGAFTSRFTQVENDFPVTIVDVAGRTTNIVRLSSPLTSAVYSYWTRADLSNTRASSAMLAIVVVHTGSTQKLQLYTYQWETEFTGIFGPAFSISDWEGAADSGYGLLMVQTDLEEIGYTFFALTRE